MILEILLIVVLTVFNGLLSMSELAVVSSRPARLGSMVEKGNRGAAVALALMEEPGKFLSAVQIGITLVGVLTVVAGLAPILTCGRARRRLRDVSWLAFLLPCWPSPRCPPAPGGRCCWPVRRRANVRPASGALASGRRGT